MPKIGTLNESSLHETLKQHFCCSGAKTEVPIDSFVCDILCPDKKIIEIQTSNLSSLKKKLSVLLKTYKVEVVFPIFENNFIRVLKKEKDKIKYAEPKNLPKSISHFEYFSPDLSASLACEKKTAYDLENTNLYEASFRKSPKHENYFSLFRELTKIYPFFRNKNFSLTLLYIDIETIKIDDKKGRSRWGNPRIVDKKLLKINRIEKIKTLEDLCEPIFDKLPEKFTRKDLEKFTNKKNASFTLWVLRKLGVIYLSNKLKNLHVYKKSITKSKN
ncbi:MAG: hypothetical protein P1P64_08790 [Treponemataceae bacterium]